MKTSSKLILLVLMMSLMTGCLRTRSDVKASEERKRFESNVMQVQADRGVQFQELQEQLAQSQGRIEVLESYIDRLKAEEGEKQKSSELEKTLLADKQRALIEAITKLENDVALLKSRNTAKAKSKSKSKQKTGPYTQATSEFKRKNWKQAIDLYDKYRSRWPKGSRYPDATYKMGVSFQELKMYDEAELFYTEVMQKFPKSKQSKKAKYRLAQIKKKKKR